MNSECSVRAIKIKIRRRLGEDATTSLEATGCEVLESVKADIPLSAAP
jgi:hypothetical protein